MFSTTLQTLPTELRLQVFRNVIPYAQAHYPYRKSSQKTDQRRTDKARVDLWPALTAVSRKIRADAIELFFNSENAFCFFEFDTFEEWANTLDNDSKFRVRRLAISIPPSFKALPEAASLDADNPNYTIAEKELEKQLLSPTRSNARATMKILKSFPNLSTPKLTLHYRVNETNHAHNRILMVYQTIISCLYEEFLDYTHSRSGMEVMMLQTTTPRLLSPHAFVNPHNSPEPVGHGWKYIILHASHFGDGVIYRTNGSLGKTTASFVPPLSLPMIELHDKLDFATFIPDASLHALGADKLICIRCSRPCSCPDFENLSDTFRTPVLECPYCNRGPYCSWECLRADDKSGRGCGAVTDIRRLPPRERFRQRLTSRMPWDARIQQEPKDYDEWALLCLGEAITMYGPSPEGEAARIAQQVRSAEEGGEEVGGVRAPRPERIPFNDLLSDGARMM